jgi:protein SCO1/2
VQIFLFHNASLFCVLVRLPRFCQGHFIELYRVLNTSYRSLEMNARQRSAKRLASLLSDVTPGAPKGKASNVPSIESCGSAQSCNKGIRFMATKSKGQASNANSTNAPGAKTFHVSYTSLGLAAVTGVGLYAYYDHLRREKMSKAALKGAQHAKVAGKADIGAPFELIEASTGKPFHSDSLKGGYSLLYFGFTHCPDICPDELEKIASAVDLIEKGSKGRTKLTPVFITLDPERDGPKQVAPYVKEFHPRMIGLTGSKEDIMKVTKSYRVYFTKAGVSEMTGSRDDDKQQDEDYLIDHSIITYLLDKEGSFVTFYGKNYTDEEMAASITQIVDNE